METRRKLNLEKKNNRIYMNRFLIILSFFIFLIILIPNINALGITPGRTSIDFSSNLQKEVSFSVINSEHKNMNIAFTVQGDLVNYIEMDKEVIAFSKNENSKNFKYKINLPKDLSPGLHQAEIIATELPEDIEDIGMIVKATVSVATQLYIYVPYPGKYIDVNFDIVNRENENLIDFYLPIISRGEEKIDKVKGIIEIYKDNEKIRTLETNEISITPGSKKELNLNWEPDIEPGEYFAYAKVVYDDKSTQEIKKIFNIGKENLGVLGISVNNFKLGDVAKIKILVQNKLSDEIEKAAANLEVYDSQLEKIADLKSPDYNIPAKSNKELVLYWDTEKIQKGQYGSELKIDYNNEFVSKNFKVDVNEDSMSFSGVGFVVASGDTGKMSTTSLLIIIIIILVLINLAWFVWWKRHKKKK